VNTVYNNGIQIQTIRRIVHTSSCGNEIQLASAALFAH